MIIHFVNITLYLRIFYIKKVLKNPHCKVVSFRLSSHYHAFGSGIHVAYLRPLSKQEKKFESVVLCSEYLWQAAGQLVL